MFLTRKPLKRFASNLPKPAPNHWNILFFGSEKFSLPTLQLLTTRYESLRKPVGNLDVITTRQQFRSDWEDGTPKRNIPHPIIDWTYQNGLGHSSPITSKTQKERGIEWSEFHSILAAKFKENPNHYHLGIICSYGFMIDSKILDLFSHGVFVVHPSLLPRYRGATPIQSALFNGDRETGIS